MVTAASVRLLQAEHCRASSAAFMQARPWVVSYILLLIFYLRGATQPLMSAHPIRVQVAFMVGSMLNDELLFDRGVLSKHTHTHPCI